MLISDISERRFFSLNTFPCIRLLRSGVRLTLLSRFHNQITFFHWRKPGIHCNCGCPTRKTTNVKETLQNAVVRNSELPFVTNQPIQCSMMQTFGLYDVFNCSGSREDAGRINISGITTLHRNLQLNTYNDWIAFSNNSFSHNTVSLLVLYQFCMVSFEN